MASRGVNKVILVGNLGQDPEVRYTPSGAAVTNLTIATSESWRDKQTGEQKERTEWHRVVMYARLAEIAGEYLRKGSKIYIEGRLQTRDWQDQSGQKRYTTEIIASELQMLDSRGQATPQNNNNWQGQGQNQAPQGQMAPHMQQQQAPATMPQNTPPAAPAPTYNEPPMDFDDDIPF